MRQHLFYYQHAGELNRTLKRAIPADRLKALHHKQAWRHFLIAGRQIALMVLLPVVIFFYQANVWIWLPAAALLGTVVFSFSVLLHEVVHKCVFQKERKQANRLLGLIYGTFSGLAASQFHRWHMDHHNQLGTDDRDPKRAHLSPKINARWYKFLYCTPALYPIYFRAARKANATYPAELQQRIKWERLLSIGWHLAIMGGMAVFVSPLFAVKAWAIPIFIFFPVAFMVNRLGQHYVIDPEDIAAWSTLMRPGPIANFLFLYSSLHLEHHYFPAVPFYNLPALQKELDPFFEARGIEAVGYGQLLKLWFIDNHVPHTKPANLARMAVSRQSN